MARFSHYSSDSDLGNAFASTYIALVVVVLIIVIYLLIKAVNLIVRAFAAYPKNKALWIALGTWAVISFLAIIFKERPEFAILALLSFCGLLVTARIVELYHNDLFQEQTPLIESVLHKPWWKGTQQQLAA